MLLTLVTALIGLALIGTSLFDAFETVVLPRRVSRRWRIARLFYRLTWRPYSFLARRIVDDARRETLLSFYGPSSLLLLVALWAVMLIIGFAILHLAAGSTLNTADNHVDFVVDLYFSGTTFFTLGLGDVAPTSGIARLLTVIESGTGFAFLALLIGYFPIVYQIFARRETNVSQLDQRAGSPPTAAELIRRNIDQGDLSELIRLLHEWEIWVADLLEGHLSYPSLAYFRSQHENQSWVAALTMILDVSAYVLACGQTAAVRQASFTFAIGRHAVGDLSNIFLTEPRKPSAERLDPAAAQRLMEIAASRGLLVAKLPDARARLTAIRASYEPYVQSLADLLLMDLPPWVPASGATDNWESTAWDFESPVDQFGPDSPFSGR